MQRDTFVHAEALTASDTVDATHVIVFPTGVGMNLTDPTYDDQGANCGGAPHV